MTAVQYGEPVGCQRLHVFCSVFSVVGQLPPIKAVSHGERQSGLGQVEDQDSASEGEAREDPSRNTAGPGEGEEAGNCFERSESAFEKGKVADEESAGESGKGLSRRTACCCCFQ